MQSVSACLLALFVLLAVGINAYDIENNFEIEELPRGAIVVPASVVEELRSRPIRRRSVVGAGTQDSGLDEMTKRAFNQHEQLAIPRGGAMISGRGWMPGFVDTPRFIYKRAAPFNMPKGDA